MKDIQVYGDITTPTRRSIKRQVYKVRDFLLEGGRLTVEIGTKRLNIGGSALPRRIKDCRDVLDMKIQARWIPYLTAENVKTKIREYWMDLDDIAAYAKENSSRMMVYPRRASVRGDRKKPSPSLSACGNI